MAEKAVCFVTNSDEGRGAFAVRADNSLNVYIPNSVADALALEAFDTIEVILVPNDRADPPYMAIRARRIDEENRH